MSKSFEQGRDEIAKLCDYFAKNELPYKAAGRTEAHTRQDLIDPLFRALGWDVGTAEVLVEDRFEIEGKEKTPDYAFRRGTIPRFFVEAKKCGVKIAGDPLSAFQLRRYGWSAKVALSILTDFAELAVYDCTVRPQPNDQATRSRILHYHFTEYVERWRELWEIFSREAVESGGFDRYAASKRKRGASEVDSEFLKEIEGWREELARNIALRNRPISSEDLNRAVQLTIDRIVFLRMAEERGLEPERQLLRIAETTNGYARFMGETCRKAAEKYNSGLFHFDKEIGVSETRDTITPQLTIDDEIFKPILQSLYLEHGSPYHFGALPVEILGTVYERFLGKVIRLTTSGETKIEERPEVRKAGGVYYTPAYIVNYIVRETVGRQVAGKSPGQLSGTKNSPPLRVLDMACGSGSFLLGAFQFLLDYHLEWYIAHDPKKHTAAVYSPRAGEWRLTIAEKKRILTAHIFGVDLDPQAVEVSKLSLFLKVFEGETDQTIGETTPLFHERALPNLAENIKCGNSIIEPDYFLDQEAFKPEEIGRINAFDWNSSFPGGGFSVIIGNPPYLNARILFQTQGLKVKDYYASHFSSAQRAYDIYVLFIEKGIRLLHEGGRLGMIIPNKLAALDYAESCRRLILESNTLEVIADVSKLQAFHSVGVYPYLITLKREVASKNHAVKVVDANHESGLDSEETVTHLLQQAMSPVKGFAIHGELDVESRVPTLPLEVRAKLHSGTTGFSAQKIANSLTERKGERSASAFDFIVSGNIDRYRVTLGDVRYMKHRYQSPVLPKECRALSAAKRTLFSNPKIIFSGMTKRLEAAYDSGGLALGVSVYAASDCKDDPKYILGLLNSKLISFLFRKRFQAKRLAGGFLAINKSQLGKLPIRIVDLTEELDRDRHSKIISHVETMLSMQESLSLTTSSLQALTLQRQITAVDTEIDRIIYDLYGLTEEEIACIERTDSNESSLSI